MKKLVIGIASGIGALGIAAGIIIVKHRRNQRCSEGSDTCYHKKLSF